MNKRPFCQITCSLLIAFYSSTILPDPVHAQAAIEVEGMNVLIAGVENPLTVVVSDMADSCLYLLPSTGRIEKYRPGKYGWSVWPDTSVVLLSLRDSCNNEPIGEWTFRVRVPRVQMTLGGFRKGIDIGLGEFKANYGIIAQVNDFDINAHLDVTGFTAEFFSTKTGELWVGYNSGARFQPDIQERINAVRPGDWVIFRQISYQSAGRSRPRISEQELIFRIK